MTEDRLDLHSAAHLQRGVDGTVLLYYRGESYQADDTIPMEIYPDIPQHNKSSARAFVHTIMLRVHGISNEQWPALVKEFLAAKPTRKK